MRVFPAQKLSDPPKNHPPSKLKIPLCDLRDLCAMLSPMRVFLAQKPSGPPKNHPPSKLKIPPL
jgi:hypothetical protein